MKLWVAQELLRGHNDLHSNVSSICSSDLSKKSETQMASAQTSNYRSDDVKPLQRHKGTPRIITNHNCTEVRWLRPGDSSNTSTVNRLLWMFIILSGLRESQPEGYATAAIKCISMRSKIMVRKKKQDPNWSKLENGSIELLFGLSTQQCT